MLASPVTLTNCATRSASNTSSVSNVCLSIKISSYCPADEALQAISILLMGNMHAGASSGTIFGSLWTHPTFGIVLEEAELYVRDAILNSLGALEA